MQQLHSEDPSTAITEHVIVGAEDLNRPFARWGLLKKP